MKNMYDKVHEFAKYIESKMELKPKVAVILGSGLGDLADDMGIVYKEGIYAGFMGPYYKTAAEIKSIGRQGADLFLKSLVLYQLK